MRGIEIAYVVSASFIVTCATIMIAVYSRTTRWWDTHVGRMLVTLAAAEGCQAAIFAAAVGLHMDPVIFRIGWIVSQATVGLMLLYQTTMIYRLNHRRKG